MDGALERVFRSDPCGDPALARIALANTHLIIIILSYCLLFILVLETSLLYTPL